MGTKNSPGDFDCYARAGADEPMFILLARDIAAPAIIREWCNHRMSLIRMGMKPESDMKIVAEALECADDMEEWRKRRAAAP